MQQINKIHLQSQATLKVAAASGLVKIDQHFFVIADDDFSLFQFSLKGQTEMVTVPLKKGSLPLEAKERKKLKPDWESLVKLTLHQDEKIILAVPSGSTDNRFMGAYLQLNDLGHLNADSKPIDVDFSILYQALQKIFSDLNIEGACVFNNYLKLFQRGNGISGINAVIDIDLDGFCKDVKDNVPINSNRIVSHKLYDLGSLSGFKLDFTDACTLDQTIWFLAVAEASASTYEDGHYHGAVLGCLDATGKELVRYEIDCPFKPEGLCIEGDSFYVVTDADNPDIYAVIYRGHVNSSTG